MAYPSPIQSRQSSKAIYTARRSYGKARQSTPITDSVKAEQERQAGAASRGELSPVKSVSHSLSNRLTLTLSLKPSHYLSLSQTLSLKVRDWNSKVLSSHKSFHWAFDSVKAFVLIRWRGTTTSFPLLFFFFFFFYLFYFLLRII